MDIRPSPIAGLWYPGDPTQLAQSVDRLLAGGRVPELGETPLGVIAPHAGHRYSGSVAAEAFRFVQGVPIDVVALVGPLHRPASVSAPAYTTAHGAYATPLGTVPVDHEALRQVDERLQDLLGGRLARLARDSEHSLEIELPFLQRALGGFQMIPLMLRTQTGRVAKALAEALAAALGRRRTLVVASSDLSHFYPQPLAEKLDRALLNRVEAFDPEGVLELEERGMGFACGKGAIAVALWATRQLGATDARVVGYATSGNVTGDFESVVGYGAAVIWKKSNQ